MRPDQAKIETKALYPLADELLSQSSLRSPPKPGWDAVLPTLWFQAAAARALPQSATDWTRGVWQNVFSGG